MGNFKYIGGLKNNNLLVIGKNPKKKNNKLYWLCLCDCGNKKMVQSYHISSGKVKSCGCLSKATSLNNLKKANKKNKEIKNKILQLGFRLCTSCKKNKPLSFFNKGKNPNMPLARCKKCSNDYRKKDIRITKKKS